MLQEEAPPLAPPEVWLDAEDPSLVLARLLVRAAALRRRGDADGAVALCTQALALDPRHPQALLDQANACLDLQQPEAALAAVARALALRPEDAHLHYTHGLALHQAQRLDEALAAFDRAQARGADAQKVRFAQAASHLMAGRYAPGWDLYEARTVREEVLAPWLLLGLAPLPPGASTGGRGLLLLAEQGLGDMLQFARFAIDLGARGVPVWLACPPALRDLLSRLPGLRGVIDGLPARASELPSGLAWVLPLASLPLHLGLAAPAQLPHAGGYLQADPARVAHWQQRLGPSTRPRVALAWAGGAGRAADWGRSLSLAQLLPWLPEGIDYLHLQPDLREADRAALAQAPQVRHFGSEIRDFEDSAALCALSDRVLTVCTSTAHLAGALGRSTTVLLRHTPCWRWGLQAETSAWYATLRLLRQPAPGRWAPVLRAVSELLAALAARRA